MKEPAFHLTMQQVVTRPDDWARCGIDYAGLRDQWFVNGRPVTDAVLGGLHRWFAMGAKP